MPNTSNTNNQSVSQAQSSPTQGTKTLAQLIQSQPKQPDFLVDGLLPIPGISILAGKPKDGKSTLVRQLIHCVATGSDFLNRKVKQGPVLYLALEETEYWVTKHFQDLQTPSSAPIHVLFDASKKAHLPALLSAIKPSLVVIDPLFLYVDVKDGNSYTEVYNEMGKLNGLANSYQTHILTVHHMKKGLSTGPDSMLGSQGLFGSVHSAIMFEAREDGSNRVIHSRQKYGQHLKPTVISFSESTGTYSFLGSVQNQTALETEVAIEEFVSEAGREVTQEEIINAIKGKKQTITDTLDRLTGKSLARSGSGKKGDKYRYSIQHPNPSAPPPSQPSNGGAQ